MARAIRLVESEEASFRKAAETCDVPKSTLERRIKKHKLFNEQIAQK